MMKRTRIHATQIVEHKSMNVAAAKMTVQVSPTRNGAANVAVEQIWTKFSAQIGQFIRARVTDPTTAEDILHDVFVKLHSQLDEFRTKPRSRAGCSSSHAMQSLTTIARESQRPN
jgi:hypothetical protein